MFWNRYFRPSMILLLVITALHWVASLNGLYWYLRWFDVMMHFLGGLWVVVFAMWALSTQYGVWIGRLMSIPRFLMLVFAVGVLWEVHEIVLGFTDLSQAEYWPDTSKDIVMDMLGAVLGTIIYKRDIRNLKNS